MGPSFAVPPEFNVLRIIQRKSEAQEQAERDLIDNKKSYCTCKSHS